TAFLQNTIYANYSTEVKRVNVSSGSSVAQSSDGFTQIAIRRILAHDPSLIEGKVGNNYCAVIIADSQWYYIHELGVSVNSFAGGVTSCVLKNGRIFGVDKTDAYKIKWSGEGGYDDWEEGISGAGWVCLENSYGKILNLIIYRDKIAVIREYGITLFTAYGTPENYKLDYLDARTPKIQQNTAVVAEENLLFYTVEGLYYFNGSEIRRAEVPLRDDLQDVNCCTANGEAYLLSGYSKSLERRAVLAVNLRQNTAYLIDGEADAMCYGEAVFAYAGTQATEIGKGEDFKYICKKVDFSLSGRKTLKEINILGGNDVRVEVSDGVNSRILWGLRGKFRPNMRGKSFKITVTGKGKIYKLEAVAEVIDEV
ncbi:MAG: hypothetical protein HDQ88_10100, partial [Clostridia bacterium]|nr:hypothetical protein [Clostridia bacterium]